MASAKTITINGREYDAVTGLPVEGTQKAAPKASSTPKSKETKSATSRNQTAAGSVHSTVQRSTTLARRAAKKPATAHKTNILRPKTGRHMDIAQSSKITKFAPNPVIKPKTASASPVKPGVPAVVKDKPAQVHPAAQRAIAKATTKKQAAIVAAKPQTSKQVKDAAIEKALATPKATQVKKGESKTKWKKRILAIAIILAVIIGSLYLVYRFIPSVSVGIAASSAGISARYPDYIPDGFAFSQPVSYSDGEVTLKFASNSNDTSYAISQKRNSWDSSAVLDKIVKPLVGDSYTTTKERGLTIYTYSRGAAWTNGGILYIISGNATLSSDQIRHIATSL